MANGRNMRGGSHSLTHRPLLTNSWLSTGKARPVSVSTKTGSSNFPGSRQYFCNWQLMQQAIQDTTTTKFKRLGSSSKGVSYDALLPNWATNAKTVGAFADVVPAFSDLGRVVWTLGSATSALSPGMVRTSWWF
jgi:hypothetical protein